MVVGWCVGAAGPRQRKGGGFLARDWGDRRAACSGKFSFLVCCWMLGMVFVVVFKTKATVSSLEFSRVQTWKILRMDSCSPPGPKSSTSLIHMPAWAEEDSRPKCHISVLVRL